MGSVTLGRQLLITQYRNLQQGFQWLCRMWVFFGHGVVKHGEGWKPQALGRREQPALTHLPLLHLPIAWSLISSYRIPSPGLKAAPPVEGDKAWGGELWVGTNISGILVALSLSCLEQSGHTVLQ